MSKVIGVDCLEEKLRLEAKIESSMEENIGRKEIHWAAVEC